MTVKELAERVIEITKSDSIIRYLDLPADDPKQRTPDINKAKEKLGFNPIVELEEGLVRTIEYFKSKGRG
jgi:UDP-glucuronate decarboxylase